MQKKIKAKEYRNKAQFARDLTLIWENCLKYNADVSSHSSPTRLPRSRSRLTYASYTMDSSRMAL